MRVAMVHWICAQDYSEYCTATRPPGARYGLIESTITLMWAGCLAYLHHTPTRLIRFLSSFTLPIASAIAHLARDTPSPRGSATATVDGESSAAEEAAEGKLTPSNRPKT
jgi:hypothetical protein